ncbi:MAG: DcaP family trimeric outer membrane transporter [Pseudomonadota bacterium]
MTDSHRRSSGITHRLLLITFAIATMATWGTAWADTDPAALEARIAELEAQLRELSMRVAEQSQRPEVPVEDLDVLKTIRKTAGDGFRVQDTAIKIGGYVDLDTHFTDLSDGSIAANSIARDFYIPSSTPIGGEGTTASDLTSEATRLFFDAAHLGGNETISAHIEMDFLGSFQGNQRVSSSFSPRLRLAFFDFSNWRFGQDWSTFQNTSAIPESASFLTLSDGMVFERQPLARYSNGPWQFAIENGDTTVLTTSGTFMESDTSLIPDLVARYNVKGDFGNVSFAALVRQLRMDLNGEDSDDLAIGLSASGRIDLTPTDQLRFNLATGTGIGRYIGLNAIAGAAVNPADGDIEAIDSTGGLIAWRHLFRNGARLTLGYSGLFADYDDIVTAAVTDSVQSFNVTVLWNTAPKVTLGVEAQYGQRELTNGDNGTITRFTFSTKYSF